MIFNDEENDLVSYINIKIENDFFDRQKLSRIVYHYFLGRLAEYLNDC